MLADVSSLLVRCAGLEVPRLAYTPCCVASWDPLGGVLNCGEWSVKKGSPYNLNGLAMSHQ